VDAKRLIASVRSPLTLAVSAAGGATFLLSGLWWVLPLTACAAAIVSATQYRGELAGEELRGAYASWERALLSQVARIEETLAVSRGPIRTCLEEVPKQLQDMRGKVRSLLARQARIDAFVAEVQPQDAQAALARLERLRSAAKTEDARVKYAAALQNKRAEMEAREDLRAQSERIAAELAEMESALASTLTKIVSMEDLQGEAVRESGEGISLRLGDVLATVDALEEALAQIADPRQRRARI
jgi:chromosome segregation ATPase